MVILLIPSCLSVFCYLVHVHFACLNYCVVDGLSVGLPTYPFLTCCLGP